MCRETPEPVDVGPQEITFEEYKKQQSRQKPEFNLRKVEGDKKSKELKKPTEKDNETTSAFFFPKKVSVLFNSMVTLYRQIQLAVFPLSSETYCTPNYLHSTL